MSVKSFLRPTYILIFTAHTLLLLFKIIYYISHIHIFFKKLLILIFLISDDFLKCILAFILLNIEQVSLWLGFNILVGLRRSMLLLVMRIRTYSIAVNLNAWVDKISVAEINLANELIANRLHTWFHIFFIKTASFTNAKMHMLNWLSVNMRVF